VRVHNLMTRHDTSPFAEVRKWIGSGIHDMAYPTWRKAAIRTFKVTLGDFFRRTFETPRGTVRVSRTPGWVDGPTKLHTLPRGRWYMAPSKRGRSFLFLLLNSAPRRGASIKRREIMRREFLSGESVIIALHRLWPEQNHENSPTCSVSACPQARSAYFFAVFFV
jgi:hypothetical protein